MGTIAAAQTGTIIMPKSKHRRRQQPITRPQILPPPGATPTISVQLGYDPKGPSEAVDIISSKDGWSEYMLADGTVIRAKGVVLDVKKMIGQFNAEGEPIYVLQLTMINQARVPERLKKKSA
jgi:hypothetical protein